MIDPDALASKMTTNLLREGVSKGDSDTTITSNKILSKNSNNIVILSSGVPILHVIATPFPKQWHKSGDNLNTVHFPTVEKLNKIFRLFVAEYLQLPTQLWDEAEDDGVGSDNEPRATIDRKHKWKSDYI